MSAPLRHTVAAEEAGRSLRDLLRNNLGLSESALRSAKWGQRLLVDGQPAPVRTLLSAGSLVEVLPDPRPPAYVPRPLEIPLRIPWQSEELLVIDKDAPLASQSGKLHPDDSLENAVYAYLGCPPDFVYRPVNRLDKGTSGLMAVALTAREQARLQRLLHTEAFSRVYLAVTDGLPPEEKGVIRLPIGKAEGATIRREVTAGGRPCVTHYETLAVSGSRALLRLRLETGRTHQIRVHLAALGCPVFGDFLYGRESQELPGRFALHSCALTLPDRNGRPVRLTSPLPEALDRLIR